MMNPPPWKNSMLPPASFGGSYHRAGRPPADRSRIVTLERGRKFVGRNAVVRSACAYPARNASRPGCCAGSRRTNCSSAAICGSINVPSAARIRALSDPAARPARIAARCTNNRGEIASRQTDRRPDPYFNPAAPELSDNDVDTGPGVTLVRRHVHCDRASQLAQSIDRCHPTFIDLSSTCGIRKPETR